MNKTLGLNLSPEKDFAVSFRGLVTCKETMQRSRLNALGPFVAVLMLVHTVITAEWMKAEY